MILALILACEVAFWVAIVAGLIARYPLRRPRLGAILLLSAPVIDIVLLVLVGIDLLRGGVASWHHGLAAIYIGFSVAYGHRVVAWADVRIAHRFAGGPAPEKLYGAKYTAKTWYDVARTLLMAAIAGAITLGLTLLVGDPARTSQLDVNYRVLAIIITIDLIWAISYTIWPKVAPQQASQQQVA